jgi:diguanylate cyclase
MRLRVDSYRQVIIYALIVTLFAVTVPVAVVACVVNFTHTLAGSQTSGIFALAFFIPLFLAPPIALLVFHNMWLLTTMLAKVDSHVKFDGLTGVLNRGHFLDSVRGRMADGILMIVDADHFKPVNDRFGHAVGDEALRILANAISLAVGPTGLVGRLGGEEFAVFLPGKSLNEGQRVADHICKSIRSLDALILGNHVPLTVSIGGTLHRYTTTIGHSLRVADDYLYRAKNGGRDHALFTSMSSEALQA